MAMARRNDDNDRFDQLPRRSDRRVMYDGLEQPGNRDFRA